MYKDIEDFYKKKSPYDIISKRILLIYIVFVVASLYLNYINKEIEVILIFILMLIVMKKTCEGVLHRKLYYKFHQTKDNEKPLPDIIRDEEKKLFKEYSIKKNMYNEKGLLCIINHYRNLTKTKVSGGNLLTILSIAIPTIISFYTKDGFDFNGLSYAFPYLTIFGIVIIILYISYNKFIESNNFLKGKNRMIERLEEIFSELYVEYVNETTLAEKSKLQRRKRTKKLE